MELFGIFLNIYFLTKRGTLYLHFLHQNTQDVSTINTLNSSKDLSVQLKEIN